MNVFRILSLNQIAIDLQQPDAILLRSADQHPLPIPHSLLAVARSCHC